MEAEENAEQLVLVMRSRTRMLGWSLAMTSWTRYQLVFCSALLVEIFSSASIGAMAFLLITLTEPSAISFLFMTSFWYLSRTKLEKSIFVFSHGNCDIFPHCIPQIIRTPRVRSQIQNLLLTIHPDPFINGSTYVMVLFTEVEGPSVIENFLVHLPHFLSDVQSRTNSVTPCMKKT